MRFRLIACPVSGAFAACVLAAPAAHAFTMENRDAAGQYGVPKFDLEEQAKNFRKRRRRRRRPARPTSARRSATARCQFGVTQGPAFGSGLGVRPGGFGPADGAQPRGRTSTAMLAPPTSLEYNGVR